MPIFHRKNVIANEKSAIFNGFSLETWRNDLENPITYLKSGKNFDLELSVDFWAIIKFLSRTFGCNISNFQFWSILKKCYRKRKKCYF